jgi:hypothetical protein
MNLHLEIILLHGLSGPPAFHELGLRDQHSAGVDQRHQHIERAAAELDRLAVRRQLALPAAHLEATKA